MDGGERDVVSPGPQKPNLNKASNLVGNSVLELNLRTAPAAHKLRTIALLDFGLSRCGFYC